MKHTITAITIGISICSIILLIAYFNTNIATVVLMVLGWWLIFEKSEKLSKWLRNKTL